MAENLNAGIELALGQEFLTWLWFHSEVQNGTFHTLKDNSPYILYIHQRIVVRGGEGDATETASVSGVNSALKEAKMGLQIGKLVVRALVRIEKGELDWQLTLKAEDFSLNSLKTAAVAKEDRDDDNPDALFLEKIYLIEEGLELIDDVYHQFLKTRLDSKAWSDECKAINKWINQE